MLLSLQGQILEPFPPTAQNNSLEFKSNLVQYRNKMTNPQLPRELSDVALKLLHDDKAALASCALVHSSWLATSRTLQFRSLTITQSHKDRDLAQFFSFIKIWPTIGRHIVRLQVRGNRSQRENDQPALRPETHWQIIEEMVPYLPFLISLRLVGLYFHGRRSEPTEDSDDTAPTASIRRLEFDRCGREDINITGFIHILDAFAAIDVLAVKSVLWNRAAGGLLDNLILAEGVNVKIGSLALQDSGGNGNERRSNIECLRVVHLLRHAIEGSEQPPPIEDLALKLDSLQDLAFVSAFVFPHLGPHVLNFSFDFSNAILAERVRGYTRESPLVPLSKVGRSLTPVTSVLQRARKIGVYSTSLCSSVSLRL